MVRITFGDNLDKQTKLVNESQTIRQFMTENNFSAGSRSIMLSGRTLAEEDLDKSFAANGVTDSAYLLAVANKQNA